MQWEQQMLNENVFEYFTAILIIKHEKIHRVFYYLVCVFIAQSKSYDCVKTVYIRSFSGPYFTVFRLNRGKYGPEKTPYLDTFHVVYSSKVSYCQNSDVSQEPGVLMLWNNF